MFDGSTSTKFWKIVGIGVLAAPALYVIAFILDLCICFLTCEIWDTYTCLIPGMWTGAAFGNTFLFLFLASIAIATIYAIASTSQQASARLAAKRAAEAEATEAERRRREEEARRQATAERQQNAKELTATYKRISAHCESNRKNGDSIQLTPSYKSSAVQEQIWAIRNEISVPLQTLEDLVKEMLSMKGDA